MFEATFTKNEADKTMTVERRFSAPKNRVWLAWTDSTLLEKWWAPRPWKAITKSFSFTEGGQWFYNMSGPNGEVNWCVVKYESITPTDSFSAQDEFCDEVGNRNTSLPSMNWLNEFSEVAGMTKVKVTITFETLESLNKIIEMQMQEGLAMAFRNLDELLNT